MATDTSQSVADRNREYFDKMAKKYDAEDWIKYLTERFDAELRASVNWLDVKWAQPEQESREVRMLDFACGPGMASEAFFDRITSARGIDISPNMVEEYNQRAANKGRSPTQMHAVVGDIFASPPDAAIAGQEFFEFNLAVISGALHHMESPELTLKKLAERLKEGGTLLVLDFLPFEAGAAHSEHGHGHQHDTAPVVEINSGLTDADYDHAQKTITKHGFTREEMHTLLSGAGYTGIDFKEVQETFRFGGGKVKGKDRRVFLCRAKKA